METVLGFGPETEMPLLQPKGLAVFVGYNERRGNAGIQ